MTVLGFLAIITVLRMARSMLLCCKLIGAWFQICMVQCMISVMTYRTVCQAVACAYVYNYAAVLPLQALCLDSSARPLALRHVCGKQAECAHSLAIAESLANRTSYQLYLQQ